MRKDLILLVTALLGLSAVLAGPVPQTDQSDERAPITFEDVIVNGLGTRGFSGSWISGNRLMYREDGALKVMTVNTQVVDTVLDSEQLTKLQGTSYTIAPSWNKILVRYADRSIFRHSIVAKYGLVEYPFADPFEIVPIANSAELSTCVLAPKTDKLAFVRNNDVYVKNEAGEETRLTTDGISGEIYNGVADWVYEEEIMSSSAALWFSPDGNKLAIVKFVDTSVDEFTYYMYGTPGDIADQYPEAIKLRYPKSGTTNPTITVQVRDVSDAGIATSTWTVITPPASLVNAEPIIGAVKWTKDNELITFWMNRRQNKAILQRCTVDTLTCEDVVSFDEPTGWIPNVRPVCLADGSACVIIAADNKWFKAVKIDLVAKTKTPLTPDGVTVQTIYGYTTSTSAPDTVYYLGVPADQAEDRNVYRNDVCLSCSITDANGVPCTYASAAFSTTNAYYTLTCSGPTPSHTKIMQTSTNAVHIPWEDNKAAREKLANMQQPITHFMTIPVEGGFEATVRMRVPAEVDITATSFAKKYPMIVTVYGGPNSVRAVSSFSFGYQDYLVSSRKVIDVSIDGRGCSNKGLDMLFSVNNQLGTLEIEDQIAVAKKLQEMFKFIDAERSGIWGWSYGGYATAMALSKDTERVFQCGISVAPVTSWIYYDTMYTERYMDTPANNAAGYNASDVTKNLEQFKYHDFMLIHGNAVDNVHFQQAMALSRALQQENIMFEQMSYPDEAHGLNGVSKHLYHTMDQFWEKCLSFDD